MDSSLPSEDLLESTHSFPGVYQFKAIGQAGGGFEERVVLAVQEVVPAASEGDVKARVTPGGRHVSLTLRLNVQSAAQVREIYANVKLVDGLVMLL